MELDFEPLDLELEEFLQDYQDDKGIPSISGRYVTRETWYHTLQKVKFQIINPKTAFEPFEWSDDWKSKVKYMVKLLEGLTRENDIESSLDTIDSLYHHARCVEDEVKSRVLRIRHGHYLKNLLSAEDRRDYEEILEGNPLYYMCYDQCFGYER